MKKILMLILTVTLLGASACVKAKDVEIYYLYFNPCASCDPDKVFYELFYETIKQVDVKKEYTLHVVNTFEDKDGKAELFKKYGIDSSNSNSTILIVGDEYYIGQPEIEDHLLEALSACLQ